MGPRGRSAGIRRRASPEVAVRSLPSITIQIGGKEESGVGESGGEWEGGEVSVVDRGGK